MILENNGTAGNAHRAMIARWGTSVPSRHNVRRMSYGHYLFVAAMGATLIGVFNIVPLSALINTSGIPQDIGIQSNRVVAAEKDPVVHVASVEQVKQVEPSDDRRNLEQKVDMLRRGRTFMETVQDYSALLCKQEVVRDELLDEQSMVIKCRQKPLSIYLRWTAGEEGREVIYVEGKNHGKMIAHDGGWKARIPAFKISPECNLAMKDARYPATKAGLVFLIDTMLEIHEGDLQSSAVDSCQTSDHEFDGRACLQFTTKYKSSDVSPTYRKSITLIDREWNVPLQSQHFQWPERDEHLSDDELDRATLIEKYSFYDLDLHEQFADSAFDPANKDYNFH